MINSKKRQHLLFWSIEILIGATLIFVLSKIGFLFQPVGTFFSTLFIPVLIAGFLYYVLNPVVNLLTGRFHFKRIMAIIFVFLLLLVALVLIVVSVIPNLVNQIAQLAMNIPSFASDVEDWLNKLSRTEWLKKVDIMNEIEKFNISYGTLLQKFLSGVSSSLGSIVSTIANAAMIIITVPFILFYMLKDGHKFVPNVEKVLSPKRSNQVADLLGQLNKTLSNYISGQAIECLFVGTFTFLGYLILGVDYAFLFGVIAGLANLIPYLGPYIGLLPAVMVTVFNDPFKALLCCVVVLVVQQLDGNIIYPNVIGKSLAIHPLTIIIVLLVAGNLAGLLGIFLGVPFYAICRTIIVFLYKLLIEARENKEEQPEKDSVANNGSL
ncbi:AI-2E family transporter [Enterococcus camelliae]|uniref:AI-2E family transporter n=1 Tax=Enterococcus camelliae TaxID=453959 RepID=A0ABW5TIG8_9ENTE